MSTIRQYVNLQKYNLASTDSQRNGLTRLKPPTSPARIARIAIRDAPWSAAPLYAFFLRANCSQLPFSTFLNFPHRCCSEPHDLPRIARNGLNGLPGLRRSWSSTTRTAATGLNGLPGLRRVPFQSGPIRTRPSSKKSPSKSNPANPAQAGPCH